MGTSYGCGRSPRNTVALCLNPRNPCAHPTHTRHRGGKLRSSHQTMPFRQASPFNPGTPACTMQAAHIPLLPTYVACTATTHVVHHAAGAEPNPKPTPLLLIHATGARLQLRRDWPPVLRAGAAPRAPRHTAAARPDCGWRRTAYTTLALAPASRSCAFAASASSLLSPSLSTLGRVAVKSFTWLTAIAAMLRTTL